MRAHREPGGEPAVVVGKVVICPVLTRCGWQVPGPALSDQAGRGAFKISAR
jgi:hypothetical protein